MFGPFPPPEPVEPKPIDAREGRAGGAARGAARDRRRDERPRGAAARLPRPRAEARLLGALRQGGHDAEEHCSRTRTAIGGSRAHRGAAARQELDRLRVHLPGAGAEDRRRALSTTPTLHERRRAPQPRPRRAQTRAQARPELADVPLPQALLPGGPYRHEEQESALERIGRSLLAADGRYPAIESVLRAATRSTATSRPTRSRR